MIGFSLSVWLQDEPYSLPIFTTITHPEVEFMAGAIYQFTVPGAVSQEFGSKCLFRFDSTESRSGLRALQYQVLA